jgi:Protein of unknown function (DUF3800)
MFIVYLDDSGTSPSQRVAIAAALVIPVRQLVRLQSEWNALRAKERFLEFHTSEFVAKNQHSEFAGWDSVKQTRVFKRVRDISKKYGIKAISFTVNKRDYEDAVPSEFRDFFGNHHYTWAVRHLLGFVEGWRLERKIKNPHEYVFDWSERTDRGRKEIESAMDQAQFFTTERGMGGDFTHYSFRRRKDVPGLQCVDVLGWTCYQYGL